MENHITILESLINFSKQIDILEKEVSNLDWDNYIELIEIKQLHLKEVIKRLNIGELNKDEVERWANLIECREDIKFENGIVKENLEKLANPTLY